LKIWTWIAIGHHMRRILLLACLVIAPYTTSQAQSFPLTCKGSSSTTVRVVPDVHEVFINFQKGSQPAGGGANLAPGSCSWADRGMGPSESPVLCAKQIFNYQVVLPGATGTPRYSFVQPYISRMQQDGQILTFQVHGEFTTEHVENCLVIDRAP
jgi:hypothetical protein